MAHVPTCARVETFGLAPPGADWHDDGGTLRGPGGRGRARGGRAAPRAARTTSPTRWPRRRPPAAAARRSTAPRRALTSFSGLPHRVTPVGEADGRALVRRLEGDRAPRHRGRGVVVRLGRAHRRRPEQGPRPGVRSPTLAPRLRAVVAIGDAADEVAAVFDGRVPVVTAGSMDEAVRRGPSGRPPRRRRAAVAGLRVVRLVRLVRRAGRRLRPRRPCRAGRRLVTVTQRPARPSRPSRPAPPARRPDPPGGARRPAGHRDDRVLVAPRHHRRAQPARPGDGPLRVVGRRARRDRVDLVLLRPPDHVGRHRLGRAVRLRGARPPARAAPVPARVRLLGVHAPAGDGAGPRCRGERRHPLARRRTAPDPAVGVRQVRAPAVRRRPARRARRARCTTPPARSGR